MNSDVALNEPFPPKKQRPTPFQNYVLSAEAAGQLPCVHTCEAISFRGISGSRKLAGERADKNVFLFYGRPVYRPSKTNLSTRNYAYAPITLVLRREHLTSPDKIFPFDSGGFESDLYQRHFHPSMALDDFLFKGTIEIAGKIVSRFYETNKGYYAGTAGRQGPPPVEFEAVSYYNLISDPGPAEFDDRCGSIELQVPHEIHLPRSSVELVVLPTQCLADPAYRETILKFWGAEVRDYAYYHDRPNSYITQIRSLVKEFYEDSGYL